MPKVESIIMPSGGWWRRRADDLHSGTRCAQRLFLRGDQIHRKLCDKVIAATHNVHFAILFSSINFNLRCLRIGTGSFLPAGSASARWVSDH
jgi:hypothetical protein